MSNGPFIDKIRSQLEDWNYQLDRLEHRLEDLAHDGQQRARDKIADFKHKRKQLEGRLAELEDTSERAFDDLRDGIELAWDGLKTGFFAARSEFEDDDKKD